MKLYISNDFTGHYPVGSAAVVVAENADQAATMLQDLLRDRGLRFNGTLTELPLDHPNAAILNDGDY